MFTRLLALSCVLWSSLALATVNAKPTGPGIAITATTSAPTPTGKARVWARSSNGHLIFTDTLNIDHDLLSGIAGYNLIQSNGSAMTQQQTLNFYPAFSVTNESGSSRTSVNLALTGVTAGSYTGANITVDGFGRITSASSGAGANPTATIGLTAVNGSATTFMRSDAAPALSLSISPTWSGTHTFSNPITVHGYSIDPAYTTPTNGQSLVYSTTANAFVPQTGGGAITALTGDVTASGTGSVSATLATTQSAAHTWSSFQTFSTGISIHGYTINPSYTTPTDGQALAWSSTYSQYIPQTISGGGGTAANPTASVGTTAVNGTATTFMRSDAAPALSLTMSPTMTGSWLFTGSTFGAKPTGTLTLEAPTINLGVLSTSVATTIGNSSGTTTIAGGITENGTGNINVDSVSGNNMNYGTNYANAVILSRINATGVLVQGDMYVEAGFSTPSTTCSTTSCAFTSHNHIMLVSNTTATTVTLVAPAIGVNHMVIKDTLGSTRSSNAITINPPSSGHIDGATSATLSTSYGIARFFCTSSTQCYSE